MRLVVWEGGERGADRDMLTAKTVGAMRFRKSINSSGGRRRGPRGCKTARHDRSSLPVADRLRFSATGSAVEVILWRYSAMVTRTRERLEQVIHAFIQKAIY